MIKTYTILLACFLLIISHTDAQKKESFGSVTKLTPLPITNNTADKPQSKVWTHAGKWWSVLSDSEGTHVWRLDGTSWTRALTLTKIAYAKADCKVAGNTVHIFMFRSIHTHYLSSIQFNQGTGTYELWSQRPTLVNIPLEREAETATIDIDSKGRMWLASDGASSVNVRWSDSPYSTWSDPITLASGIKDDDISAVVALPGKIGVLWSDQTSKKFGFKTHIDGDNPLAWSANEVPASESAQNKGLGMADDHLNMAVASDGTLYCAVKTGYDAPGYTQIALLVRRPSGSWGNLYKITDTEGTRPIVTLNEELGIVRVIYSDNEYGGNILYKEAFTSSLAFCNPPQTLLSGKFNYATSMKASYSSQTVVLATNEGTAPLQAVGVIISDTAPSPEARLGCDQEPKNVFVYPNPFSDRATISFTLDEGGEYTIMIYDSKGAQIIEPYQRITGAGELNEITLNGIGLARGLYVVRLRTASSVYTAKIVNEK